MSIMSNGIPTVKPSRPSPAACPVCEVDWPCPDLLSALGMVAGLADLEAEISQYWQPPAGPGDAREWGSAGDVRTEATGPTAVDQAWKAGYDAGAEDAEQRIRDLELDLERMRVERDALRYELAAVYR